MAAPATTVFMSHDNTTFVEVTSSVAAGGGLGVNFQRGRSQVLGQWLPGTCSITFRNHLRTVDPTNDSATFQPRPGDAIKIRVAGNDTWRGWVDGITITYAQGGLYPNSTMVIVGSDDLAVVARQIHYGHRACELTSARVSGLLSDISWTRATSVATGVRNVSGAQLTTINNYTVLAADTTARPTLELLQAATTVEGGASQLFIAKAGTLTWRARSHRSSTVVSVGGTGIGFQAIDTSYTDDEWFNSAQITQQEFFEETTSSTSVTTGTGSKTFTIATGLTVEAGENVEIDSSGSTSVMIGTVTSYTSGSGSLVVNVTSIVGSGAHTDWVVRFTAAGITTESNGTVNGFFAPTAQTATDTASVTRHNSTRTFTASLPIISPTTAALVAAEIAAGRGYPQRRVDSVVIDVAALSGANQATMLALEIGDALAVYLDLGSGDPRIIRQTLRIDGITHSVPGDGSHRVTFTLGREATVDFTAVVKQNGATVASTTNDATYVSRDGWVTAHFKLSITAAGTNNTALIVTPTGLPAPATSAGNTVGVFQYFDSGLAVYTGYIDWDGTNLTFGVHNNGGVQLGQTPTFAAANLDVIYGTVTFRMA